MGTPLLTLGVAVALLAAPMSGLGADGSADPRGHAQVSCAACHNGPLLPRMTEASVPDATCIASGCHADHGPAEAEIGGVTFAHRDHGLRGVGAACASCHTHASRTRIAEGGQDQTVTLRASADPCLLCHASAASGEQPDECRICHERPSAITLTSQGAEIPHERFRTLGLDCTRCHHDVSSPSTRVSAATCGECHEPRELADGAPASAELHRRHRLHPCERCHEAPQHEVLAMSSVVDLRCGDCHAGGHDLPVPRSAATTVCRTCHLDAHVEVQRFVLGTVDVEDALPSTKFIGGVTCSGCHAEGLAMSPAPVTLDATHPDGRACRACHPDGYDDVFAMWREGLDARDAELTRLLARATEAVGSREEGRSALQNAKSALDVVREANGVHNLELAHRLYERAWQHTREGMIAAGVDPPSRPELGPRPHIGSCTYCHYDRPAAPRIEDMDPAIHARLDRHRQRIAPESREPRSK